MQTLHWRTGYVDAQYLDVAGAVLRPIKQRSYELMRVCAGQIVLDLGCGLGFDTMNLANLVGPSGYVVGVDNDQHMIAEANRRMQQAGLSDRTSHQLGEATALLHPADHFDACRIERMLMHLVDPSRVVAELNRVLRPGGWLVLVEPDWGTLSIATEKVDFERRLARIRAEQILKNGYSGRQLYQLIRQMNFEEIAVEVTPVWLNDLARVRYLTILDQVEAFAIAEGLISHAELEDWRSDLQQKDDQGCVFASVNIVMVAGRKPVRSEQNTRDHVLRPGKPDSFYPCSETETQG
jgi:ubiquinone/menaquinone biosynthesis C-methylase UbiE